MLSDENRRVLVAGGGIGGLAAALALAQAGMPVQVLEQTEKFSEAGAGIQLGPNGVHVLRALGVADAVARRAVVPEGIHIFDALTGQCLTTVPLGPMAEMRYGAPYWVVHRADLQHALLDAVKANDNVTLKQPFRLVRCLAEGHQVRVVSEKDATVTGGGLLGADGLRSTVRDSMGVDAIPVFTGKNAWRVTVPLDQAAAPMRQNAIGLWLAPRAHLVHYPVRGGSEINLVVIVDDPASPEGWNEPGAPQDFLAHLAGWPEMIIAFLANQLGWRRWALYDLPPLSRWSSGCIGLLGDAAHPVRPFLASGGVLALEDAAVLGHAISGTKGDFKAALDIYARKRRPRATRVQVRSRRMGNIYHMSGVLRWSRNQVLTTQSPLSLLCQNDWLYGHRADGA